MDRRTSEVARRRLAWGGRTLMVIGVVALMIGLLMFPLSGAPGFVGRANAAGGGGGTTAGIPVVNATVNLTDAPSFDPSYLTVAAPSSLHLTLVNQGQIAHSFTLVNRPNFVLNRSWDPVALDAYFTANGSQVNVTLSGGNQTTVVLNFTGEQTGFSYEFVSQVPYQFQAGMLGFLNLTGAPSGPGLVANVSASATQLAWLPDAIGINTSAFPVVVDMAISNDGSNGHTFYLEGQPNYTLDPGNFSQYFAAHPPLVGMNVPTNPGQVEWANFTIQHPGVYEYICTVPGHFLAGMFGFLYVGVPVPAAPVAPSTAIVSVWVLYGGASLLGIGALLAVAALLVGRFPRSPPSAGH